jgi:hypothetical protein
MRTLLQLLILFITPVTLQGQSAEISKPPLASKPQHAAEARVMSSATKGADNKKSVYPNSHMDDVAQKIGLTTIEYGHFEKDEDDRFITNIKNAHNIKILVSNGSSLINNFKTEFTDFLAKPGSSMQVLLATADSDFYREETELTSGFKPGEEGYNKNLGLVALARSRLESYAGPQNLGHLRVRYFDTQFRFPTIIIDSRYCYLTIRLSPNEPSQSMRMEFDQGEGSASPNYATSCVKHFDRLWELSSPDAQSNRWLAAFGLASWSRTELMALVACIGTLLAGIGALLAVPPIQRLLRLEKQLVRADLKKAELKIPKSEDKADTVKGLSDAKNPAKKSRPHK